MRESRASFWIWGPPDTGKTHFLNFVLATRYTTATHEIGNGRTLTLGLDLSGPQEMGQLDFLLFHSIARELGGSRRDARLWQELGPAQGLSVALGEARRAGVRDLTLAIDFGELEPASLLELFDTFQSILKVTRSPKVTLFVATRSAPPDWAISLKVGPVSEDELVEVALARGRELKPQAKEIVERFYTPSQRSVAGTQQIFPFHPQTKHVIRGLMPAGLGVGGLAELVAEILFGPGSRPLLKLRRLLKPADLLVSEAVRRRVDALLGEKGRTAFKTARAAAKPLDGVTQNLALAIIDSLVLAYLNAREIGLDELADYVPDPNEELEQSAYSILRHLAQHSNGAVRFDGHFARFNPELFEGEMFASYNAAVPLLKRLDPALGETESEQELRESLGRLATTIDNAVLVAHSIDETLKSLSPNWRTEALSRYAQDFDNFVEAVSRGARAIIEEAACVENRERLAQAFDAFRALKEIATLVPQTLQMRAYLEGSGLLEPAEETTTAQGLAATTAKLRTDARLLAAELTLKVLGNSRTAYEALQARFARFKVDYAQHYRVLHRQWLLELQKLKRQIENARAWLEALARLDSIEVLGPPKAPNFACELEAMARAVPECASEELSELDRVPRCLSCGYVLGASLPSVDDLQSRLKQALEAKLVQLSQKAIRRLIVIHDKKGRLEGFLKIVQAAQTEALVKVLDDDLTGYLRRLLDEKIDAIELPEAKLKKRWEVAGEGGAFKSGASVVSRKVVISINRQPNKRPPQQK